jgi:hypothetical protein
MGSTFLESCDQSRAPWEILYTCVALITHTVWNEAFRTSIIELKQQSQTYADIALEPNRTLNLILFGYFIALTALQILFFFCLSSKWQVLQWQRSLSLYIQHLESSIQEVLFEWICGLTDTEWIKAQASCSVCLVVMTGSPEPLMLSSRNPPSTITSPPSETLYS